MACRTTAIEALRGTPGPELMLLDVSLPGMNGATAVRTIKSLSPGTRVFMFSTLYDRERAAEAKTGGASGYLRKVDLLERTTRTLRAAVALSASAPDAPSRPG